jgi:hypothetical protein
MRVRELIEALKLLDQDLEIYVEGYEGGINDAAIVNTIEVIRDVNDEWYYGRHENASTLAEVVIQDFLDEGKEITQGVIIR